MRIYKITSRHSQLVDVSTPHSQADISGVGFQKAVILPWDYDSIGQGTWSYGSFGGNQFLNGVFTNSAAPADGDNVSYKVYLAKGTYTLIVFGGKDTNAGIMDIDIDGTEVASFDQYADTQTTNVRFEKTGINITSDGIKTLRFRVDGKNANSTDYIIRVSYIVLIRTA